MEICSANSIINPSNNQVLGYDGSLRLLRHSHKYHFYLWLPYQIRLNFHKTLCLQSLYGREFKLSSTYLHGSWPLTSLKVNQAFYNNIFIEPKNQLWGAETNKCQVRLFSLIFSGQTVYSLYSSNFLYLVLVHRNKFAVNFALFPGGQHNTHKKRTFWQICGEDKVRKTSKIVHSNFFFQQLTILIVIFYHCVQKKNSPNLLHFQITCMLLTVKSNASKLTTNQSLIKPHTESCSTLMTRNLSNQLEGKGKITTFNIYLACWHKSVCFKLLQQVCITNAIILWGFISWKASTRFFSFHPCWTLPKHSKSDLSDGKEL